MIFAIDGLQLSLPYELSKEGYKLTKKDEYCKGLISCLFDVNNQLLVDCYMSNCVVCYEIFDCAFKYCSCKQNIMCNVCYLKWSKCVNCEN